MVQWLLRRHAYEEMIPSSTPVMLGLVKLFLQVSRKETGVALLRPVNTRTGCVIHSLGRAPLSNVKIIPQARI